MQPTTENLWITKLVTRNKTLNPRNTHEKNFGPTKYLREKILDRRSTHERTHEIPTRKDFGPTKYPRRHDGAMTLYPRDARWRVTHKT